ncbi:MAG: dihydrofolate reductase family protein [Bacteroidetes bacterium]|nr:dihydrofolate reductase family protein [Bacteroidota bacterium]
MRNIVYNINLSLDGCCDHTKFGPDEELFPYFTQLIKDAGLVVYGRTTYQLMFPYWADVAKNQSETEAINDFARALTAVDKLVFSRTLDSVDHNTKLLHGDLENEMRRLKQQSGKNILIGGVDLPTQLIALNLVDEFQFVLHPTIVGEGRYLAEGANLAENLNLKLAGTQTFKSGCIWLHYVR